jgi:membrane protease YdiL (CAAX protease family)
MISKKDVFLPLGLMAVLTFAIPAMQWFVGQFAPLSMYQEILGSLFVISCVSLWHWRTKSFSFLPHSPHWKTICYLGWLIALGLLIINIQSAPMAKITGQARSPFEVIDVIVLSPAAEELVFRGVIWSIFIRLSKNSRWSTVFVIMGSSLLFGIEHLGYWAQSNWPLPIDAYLHALSMVVAGICFGMFRQISRSLAVPVAVHMLANGAILLIQ